MSTIYTITPAEIDPTEARTFLTGLAGAEMPFRLRRWWITCDTTTSFVMEVHILRVETQGTGTTVTPVPMGKTSQAAKSTWKSNITVEPTAGAILYRYHVNLLSGKEVVYAEAEMPYVPGVTSEGIAIELLDDPNLEINVGFIIEELG